MKKSILKLTILFCCLVINITAFTQTSWTGTTSTAWTTSTNWTNGVPTATTDAIIGDADFTGSFQPIIISAATAKTITIGITVLSVLTVNASFTVGNIYINSNGTLTQGISTILTTGNWTNGGIYTALTGAIVTFNGIIQYLGGSSITTFRTLNINSSNTVTLTSNVVLNASGLTTGVINIQSGTFDLSTFTADRGTGVPGGTISISGGALLKIGGTNGFPANYASNPINALSTVEYNGADQLVGSRIYGNLVLSSSGGAVVKTAVGNVVANGSITIGASTAFNGGSFSHSVAGNWINNGTFTAGTSTITFKGASGISGNPLQNFNDLAVTGSLDLLSSGTVQIRNLNIGSGANLILNDATLQIAGTLSSTGTFDASTGALEMNGTTSQTIPSNIFLSNALDNLVISNPQDVTLAGAVDVYGSLTYSATGTTLNTNDFLTLKSNESGTARVGNMTGKTITGKVTVERYISANRAWRFVTSPVEAFGAETILNAWQEGVNNPSLNSNIDPNPGYGTHITGSNPSAGFDKGINNNVGIKGYNTTLEKWEALPNTNATLTTDYPAYMLFVRGDRSTDLSLGLNAPSTPTVLRSAGELKVGDQPTAVGATGFTVVSNPFASALDLEHLAKNAASSNIQDNFYVWDPLINGTNGVGGFVNFIWDEEGGFYEITPDPLDGISQFIPSGSAFIARSADNTNSGTLVVKETDKSAAGETVNRPANVAGVSKLTTNLYSVNTDGKTSIVDGLLNSFSASYSNNIDNNDAIKFSNFGENLSTLRDGYTLTVERRQPILPTDTIFINMLNMKIKSYRFSFTGNNPVENNLIGYLEDSYLHTSTPIDLNSTTTFDFGIQDIPASWNPTRFRIVFRPSGALPLTLNSIKAFQYNDAVQVEWMVKNEAGIKQYEIERSNDGLHFTGIMNMEKNSAKGKYHLLDENASAGNNYYRIKTIGINGEVKYSLVVKVFISGSKQQIVLNSNIITNGTISFQLSNMPAGRYGVRLLNNLGQVMYSKQISHLQGAAGMEGIKVNTHLIKGIYMLEFITPDNKRIAEKVFKE